jgi:hypothetical protein
MLEKCHQYFINEILMDLVAGSRVEMSKSAAQPKEVPQVRAGAASLDRLRRR